MHGEVDLVVVYALLGTMVPRRTGRAERRSRWVCILNNISGKAPVYPTGLSFKSEINIPKQSQAERSRCYKTKEVVVVIIAIVIIDVVEAVCPDARMASLPRALFFRQEYPPVRQLTKATESSASRSKLSTYSVKQ